MKIGFLSMPVAGHLYPMTSLARKLRSRGHEITFVGVPDAEAIMKAAGLHFVPFCEEEYATGAVNAAYADVANLRGLEVAEYSLRVMHPPRCKATVPTNNSEVCAIRSVKERLGSSISRLISGRVLEELDVRRSRDGRYG